MDRKSEIDTAKQRTIRQDVVARYWGSEAELTKKAYDIVNTRNESIVDENGEPHPVEIGGKSYSTMNQLKEDIITIKISGEDPDYRLKELLGAIVNQVTYVKEVLVMQKMDEMNAIATREIKKKDDSAMAKVVKEVVS